MTLLVDALAVVGGLWVGRRVMRKALARARSRSRRRIGPEEPIESVDVFTAFPCRLGDVLVRRVERDEAWLAGALVLSEDRPVAALFIAPEAVQDRAVYARAARSEVAWLAPMATGALAPRGEPPSAMESSGCASNERVVCPCACNDSVRVPRKSGGGRSSRNTPVRVSCGS